MRDAEGGNSILEKKEFCPVSGSANVNGLISVLKTMKYYQPYLSGFAYFALRTKF